MQILTKRKMEKKNPQEGCTKSHWLMHKLCHSGMEPSTLQHNICIVWHPKVYGGQRVIRNLMMMIVMVMNHWW